MKQIAKIIIICSFLFVPFSVMAQESLELSETVSPAPIADNGLELELVKEEVSVQDDDVNEQKPLVSPSALTEPKPLIHIEQLGWNTFKFRSSYRLGLVEYETRWGFGDGMGSTERIVHHSYTKPGVYQVRLEILTEEGQVHSVTNTVQVGFFNLANWRLWVLILLLAAIIVLAAIIAGVTEDRVMKRTKRKKGLLADLDDESTLNSLADELGDLDSLGQIGMDTHELAEELGFLEEMEIPKPKKRKKTTQKKPMKEKKKKAVKKKQSTASKKTRKKAPAKKKKTAKKSSQSKKSVKK